MKNKKELHQDILSLTKAIQEKFPERMLSKCIAEITATIPDITHPELDIKSLKDYRDSLKALTLHIGQANPLR